MKHTQCSLKIIIKVIHGPLLKCMKYFVSANKSNKLSRENGYQYNSFYA